MKKTFQLYNRGLYKSFHTLSPLTHFFLMTTSRSVYFIKMLLKKCVLNIMTHCVIKKTHRVTKMTHCVTKETHRVTKYITYC